MPAARIGDFPHQEHSVGVTVAEVQIEISPSNMAPLFLTGIDAPAGCARQACLLEWQPGNNAAMTVNATQPVVWRSREIE